MGTDWRRRDSAVAFGKAIQQRRQHVEVYVPDKLRNRVESFLAGGTAWNHNAVLVVREVAQVMFADLGLQRPE
jgi:hypothetical protein